MIKILANDGIENAAKEALQNAGFEVHTTKIPQEELAVRINEFDVLTVRSATKVRKPLIDVITRTKLIIRGGVGLDNIDVAYAQSKGIS
jgi:D-3-phosphoglycerate dehydrogenase